MLKIIVLLLSVTVFTSSAVSQRRTTKPAPTRPASGSPAKVTTQTATTLDGRTVLLRSNGTWEFSEEAPGASTPTPIRPSAKTATLNVEAGLVYRSGDTKPVARADFLLLDKSAATIVKESGVKLSERSSSTDDGSDKSTMFQFGLALAYPASNSGDGLATVMALIKQHTIKSFTTDFGGKATVESIPQGDYYVFGFNKSAQGFVIWNVPVTLNAGSNSVVLDQNNADYAH